MLEYNLKLDGLEEFKKAILNSPDFTKQTVGRFLTQSMAVLNRVLIRNPWRIGQAGGGIPVSQGQIKGHLRDTHLREINTWDLLIKPTASYAGYVHEGTRKMEARPWLDYTIEQAQSDINRLEVNLLDDITNSLAN